MAANGDLSEQVDILVQGEGPGTSVFLFHPLSDAGHAWLDANVHDDAARLGSAVAVAHRYALDLAAGALNDGLVVR